LKPIPTEQMAHGLVKKHGAKKAYAITLTYAWDRYFSAVGRLIVKFYNRQLMTNDKG